MGNNQPLRVERTGSEVKLDEESSSPPSDEEMQISSAITLPRQLKPFIESERFSDLVFIVGPKRQRFFAHRVVVAARSKVLDQMIVDAEKTGLHPPEVELPDVAARIFQTLLKCMYSDTTDITPHIVTEVFTVAKKYEVGFLFYTFRYLCLSSFFSPLSFWLRSTR